MRVTGGEKVTKITEAILVAGVKGPMTKAALAHLRLSAKKCITIGEPGQDRSRTTQGTGYNLHTAAQMPGGLIED